MPLQLARSDFIKSQEGRIAKAGLIVVNDGGRNGGDDRDEETAPIHCAEPPSTLRLAFVHDPRRSYAGSGDFD
jgi:hypothetical protein